MRVMTYNIKSGRNHAEGLEAIVRLIAAHAPDVLGVQEVDDGMARSGGAAQTDWLTRRLRMQGVYAPALELDGGRYGIALLSRLPIERTERRSLYRPAYADAAQRPRHDSEPRVALAAHIAGAAAPLCVVVTHLGLTADQRVEQAREVADFAVEQAAGRATIILGDFNCDPDAPEMSPLRARFQDVCTVAGVEGDARFTFPSGTRGARMSNGWRGKIDGIWVSAGVRVQSARVIADESRASDHQPVLLECELEAGTGV